jgi:hypothetical protein
MFRPLLPRPAEGSFITFLINLKKSEKITRNIKHQQASKMRSKEVIRDEDFCLETAVLFLVIKTEKALIIYRQENHLLKK